MSNDVTNSPLILDTASTSTVVVSRVIWPHSIRWVPGATAAKDDQAIVKDKSGRVFWEAAIRDLGAPTTGTVTNFETIFSEPVPLFGVIMHTLGNGTVYIYFNESKNR